MDAVEIELLADRVHLGAEDISRPFDILWPIRAAAADLVVEDDRTLVSEALERREVVVRRARAAVEREQRHRTGAAVAGEAIPRAVTAKLDVSLPNYQPPTMPSYPLAEQW